jgi:hypothetical protein
VADTKGSSPIPTVQSTNINQSDDTQENGQTKYVRHKSSYDKKTLISQSDLCLARVYSRLKEFEDARKCYENVIKMDPKVYDFFNILRLT